MQRVEAAPGNGTTEGSRGKRETERRTAGGEKGRRSFGGTQHATLGPKRYEDDGKNDSTEESAFSIADDKGFEGSAENKYEEIVRGYDPSV